MTNWFRTPRLSALARKYETLCALRRGLIAHDDALLRRLSREFPGALRELDGLSLPELEARRLAVAGTPERATDGWISLIGAYHGLMQRALWIKARLGGERSPSPAVVALIQAALHAELGVGCAADFVLNVAAPPGGRLNALVLSLLATPASSAVAIEELLFGRVTLGSRTRSAPAREPSVAGS